MINFLSYGNVSNEETTKGNVLYFEPAGCFYESETSDINNHRIRTAFLNNDNKAIYLEICGHEIYPQKKKNIKEWFCNATDVFYIPENIEEKKDYLKINIDFKGYNKKELTEWINKNFNCNFTTIEILTAYHNYHVHADNGGYNLINDHVIDHKQAKMRQKAYKKIDLQYRKALNSKYSRISIASMKDNEMKICCFESDNKLKEAGLERNIIINL